MNRAMNSRHLAATALAAAAAASPLAQAGPMAVMNSTSNVLLGFDGIQVNNSNYDVRFLDGTRFALFNGCSSNANSFLFTSVTDANAASTALGAAMNQGSTLGMPFGIAAGRFSGRAVTPYAINSTATTAFVSLLDIVDQSNANAFMQGPYQVAVYGSSLPTNLETSAVANLTYAKWSVASAAAAAAATPVPEPGALGLMAVGLGAAFMAQGKVRRRRQT